jgi:hypothetical protein
MTKGVKWKYLVVCRGERLNIGEREKKTQIFNKS